MKNKSNTVSVARVVRAGRLTLEQKRQIRRILKDLNWEPGNLLQVAKASLVLGEMFGEEHHFAISGIIARWNDEG